MSPTRSTLEPHASAVPISSVSSIGDADLLATIKRLAQDERSATAALVAALAELDARQLYLGEGCSSLFVYCTRVLRLSEHAAYHRIEAARAARRFPLVLERLANGSLTLTTVTLLAPHLTPANHQRVLDAAHHRSKREVEQQVAALAPQPDLPASIRQLPNTRSAAVATPGVSPPGGSGAGGLLMRSPDRATPAAALLDLPTEVHGSPAPAAPFGVVSGAGRASGAATRVAATLQSAPPRSTS